MTRFSVVSNKTLDSIFVLPAGAAPGDYGEGRERRRTVDDKREVELRRRSRAGDREASELWAQLIFPKNE